MKSGAVCAEIRLKTVAFVLAEAIAQRVGRPPEIARVAAASTMNAPPVNFVHRTRNVSVCEEETIVERHLLVPAAQERIRRTRTTEFAWIFEDIMPYKNSIWTQAVGTL